MNNYEKLLEEAATNDLDVITDYAFKSSMKGVISKKKIALSYTLEDSSQRACILAEEIGHYKTSVGNIINLEETSNRKQEHLARLWAYNRLIGLEGIIAAYKNGCKSLTDTAEFLNVSEDFLIAALDCYKSKYGEMKQINNYIIYFEPNIGVFELK